MLYIFLHTFISKQETLLSSQHNLLLYFMENIICKSNLLFMGYPLRSLIKNKQKNIFY